MVCWGERRWHDFTQALRVFSQIQSECPSQLRPLVQKTDTHSGFTYSLTRYFLIQVVTLLFSYRFVMANVMHGCWSAAYWGYRWLVSSVSCAASSQGWEAQSNAGMSVFGVFAPADHSKFLMCVNVLCNESNSDPDAVKQRKTERPHIWEAQLEWFNILGGKNTDELEYFGTDSKIPSFLLT